MEMKFPHFAFRRGASRLGADGGVFPGRERPRIGQNGWWCGRTPTWAALEPHINRSTGDQRPRAACIGAALRHSKLSTKNGGCWLWCTPTAIGTSGTSGKPFGVGQAIWHNPHLNARNKPYYNEIYRKLRYFHWKIIHM